MEGEAPAAAGAGERVVILSGPMVVGGSPGNRARRDSQRAAASKKRWFRYYAARVRLGLEPCRMPGCERPAARLAHLVPSVEGGRYRRENLTLMCVPCDHLVGPRTVVGLPSLAEEEAALGRPLSTNGFTPPESRYPDPSVSLAEYMAWLSAPAPAAPPADLPSPT